jgi:hypothetical protein
VQAAVCRDSKGHIIKALSWISPPCDANYGEALATQLAASLAVSLDLKTFSLNGDSLVIIAALKTLALSQDWHINFVIAATLASLPASFSWEARKVHKSANFYAHHVAFWATTRGFSGCIPTYSPPPPLSPFVVERILLPLLFSLVKLLVPPFVNALLLQKQKTKKQKNKTKNKKQKTKQNKTHVLFF